jgi:flagellar protein FliS|tara:strand:+ start:478 stop:903 length:426 start_codon:yes stop_codon:yes gene_type:complete
MVNSRSSIFEVYKKIEKANDLEKSPYEVVEMVLKELNRTMHLLILEVDKKKAVLISKRNKDMTDVQKSITKYVSRSLTSIYSLQTSLDFDRGGNIATNLFHLYEFCRLQIIDAFTKNKNDGLKKAFDALNEIISAWGTIKV